MAGALPWPVSYARDCVRYVLAISVEFHLLPTAAIFESILHTFFFRWVHTCNAVRGATLAIDRTEQLRKLGKVDSMAHTWESKPKIWTEILSRFANLRGLSLPAAMPYCWSCNLTSSRPGRGGVLKFPHSVPFTMTILSTLRHPPCSWKITRSCTAARLDLPRITSIRRRRTSTIWRLASQ